MVANFDAVLIEHAILRFKGADHPSTKCKLALQTYEWRTKKELRCCDDDDIRLHDYFLQIYEAQDYRGRFRKKAV